MSKFTGLIGGPVVAVGAICTAFAIGAGLYLSGTFDAQNVAPDGVEKDVNIAPQVNDSNGNSDISKVTAPSVPDVPDPPGISAFRLEPDGRMLVAGRSQTNWETSILVDGETLKILMPDAGGEFVEFLSLEQSNQPRVLSLSMRSPDTGEDVPSSDEVIIAPMPTRAEQAQVRPADEAQQATPAVTDDGQTQEQPIDTQDPPQQAVLLSDESGVRVLQPPAATEAPPEVMSSVALDAITYSDQGDVVLSGRAQGDGFVRVYLDNQPVASSQIAPDGGWRSDLPQVDTGVYTLRVDEMDSDGTVMSRVETPFKREDRTLVDGQEKTAQTARAVTVQPGNTLWEISRDRYGEGPMYVRIFEANRDRIRDPDLIYPGQIFTVPQDQ
ncbi:MAG TPA: LysM peptidoglycan-binding domain-containing protein [Roseovarius sp.]|nr:LysM peptidoglycan-binding domain-containing protein [Roseovarius sp.]